MWFIGVEVEQEASAPPPKKNPGSAPAVSHRNKTIQRQNLSLLLTGLIQAFSSMFAA